MSTNNYQNYPQYENPDYFKDKEEADEKWEEWWLDRLTMYGNLAGEEQWRTEI